MRFWDWVFLHCAGGLENSCYGVQAHFSEFHISLSKVLTLWAALCQSKARLPKILVKIQKILEKYCYYYFFITFSLDMILIAGT